MPHSSVHCSLLRMCPYLFILLFTVVGCCFPYSLGDKNGQSLALKRIISELKDITNAKLSLDVPFLDSSDECGIRLSPLTSNLLEWHFSFTGVAGSPYDGGIYHGRILLHPDYPRKAPMISMLSPSGRWEIGKEICLSGKPSLE